MSKFNPNEVIEISDDNSNSNAGTSGVDRVKISSNDDDDSDDINFRQDSDDSDDDIIFEDDEQSESEPEVECDRWDDDCMVSNIKPQTKLIQGLHKLPGNAVSAEKDENLPKKQKYSLEMNTHLTNDITFAKIKAQFEDKEDFEAEHYEIIQNPWRVLVLKDLISNNAILDKSREEFYEVDWNIRHMDLYEFFQSNDLKELTRHHHINMVYEFIKTDLKEWVTKLTGLEFTHVSATCSFYSDTDFLLVHDDQREDRAIAYVYYLTGSEGWSGDWGGALQLFGQDDNRQPTVCVKSIQPQHNQLVLFPVSEKSYHQVGEVQCRNFARLTINGWFHIKEPLKFQSPIYNKPGCGIYSDNFNVPSDVNIDKGTWIDETYLQTDIEKEINERMEEKSELSIPYFFVSDRFDELKKALRDEGIGWKVMGPSNRRRYEYLDVDTPNQSVPEIIKSFMELFKSKQFYQQLTTYTDLTLVKMKCELQRWTANSYALLDNDNENRLDVIVCFGDEVVGGKTHYVTLEDEIQSALVTITKEHDDNCIHLVYSDTARYTSFVSNYSKDKIFYMFVASYFENQLVS